MRKIMQHRFLALLAMLMISLVSLASQPQGRKHHDGFDPKRFQAELEQFITTNACLTPREAAKFFPVYRQMGKKPNDNEACAEAIRRQDELDIQLKQLQQEYHSRFMTILPPNKVFSVIKAEERFHRQAFRRMKK